MTTESKKILIVDDFANWRGFIRTILRLTPEWQIVGEAEDGAEALRKAEELKPDLVLLDVDLPIVNGLEVARQLRESLPNAKIAFMTSDSSSEMALAGLATGALGYLLKSRVVSELLPALNSIFSEKRFVSKGVFS